MLKLVCFLLFAIYNIIIFFYSHKIFYNRTRNIKALILIVTFNLVIIFLTLLGNTIIPETAFMIVASILLAIEFKLIYNAKWLKNIFASLWLILNSFSIKLIYISIYSLVYKIDLPLIMNNKYTLLFILCLTIITSLVFTYIFVLLLPLNYMNMIISDKSSLKFSLFILLNLFIYLLINTHTLYFGDFYIGINILNIKIAIYTIICSFFAIIYTYLFSKLRLYEIKVENIEKEIIEYDESLTLLENEANYDYFTGCLKRDIIYEKIDNMLENMPFFCIVFIDIDGLKTTNDVYGHDEGDFYIKAVSEILNTEFVDKAIGRIGGDEFLVVLNHTDIYTTMKCVMRCYEMVNNLSKLFNKPYPTSISYGVVEIKPDNKLTRDEIIKLADKHMYTFKKSRKKNRK